MAAPKKPSFYHTRKNICNVKVAADILGVDVAEVERMDKEGAPVMAERLLLLWDRKYIHAPGWEGFVFSRGALIHKNKRWRPENLFQLRKDAERIHQLECEVYKLYSLTGIIKIIKKLLKEKYGVRISRFL